MLVLRTEIGWDLEVQGVRRTRHRILEHTGNISQEKDTVQYQMLV